MVAYTRPQLLNFPNLGYKAVRAIEEMLANSKLSLKKVG